MLAAHSRIDSHYCSVGHPKNYRGEFYAVPHKFDAATQDAAFDWLTAVLSP